MVDTNLPPEELAALNAKNARDNQGMSPEYSDDESCDEEPQYPGYKEMFRADIAQSYLGKGWMVFSAFFAIYYILQFGLALMNANFYSQSHELRLTQFEYEIKTFQIGSLKTNEKMELNEPLKLCGPGNDPKVVSEIEKLEKDGKLKVTKEVALLQKSAEVYDKAFLLLGVFHIIEFVRILILLSSTCLGGVFLVMIYQITALNAIYGFIAYVYAHFSLLNVHGQSCSTQQPMRSQFLIAEIIFFYVLYGFGIMFVLAFPKMAFELAHGAWRRRQQKRLDWQKEQLSCT